MQFSAWSSLFTSGNVSQGDRDIADGLCAGVVRGLSCEDSKNAFSVAAKEHTRTSELQALYAGFVSGG